MNIILMETESSLLNDLTYMQTGMSYPSHVDEYDQPAV